MPRSGGRSSSRPAPRPAPAAPAQSRGAHTAAVPANAQNHHAPAAPAPPAAATQSQGPGMLAQMAATAGSVAVGSTIGHGLSSMLFGGSSSAPVEQAAPVQAQANNANFNAAACEVQAKDFSNCLQKADLQSCSWYLEQLKACQAAASQY